ncbi:MAG: hypothetical protein HKL96_06695 [Phycisphaerales bacterium]|nr:hypothetical protein [Phycisphaerales bacterium]
MRFAWPTFGRMIGGLYFGPAGWQPQGWSDRPALTAAPGDVLTTASAPAHGPLPQAKPTEQVSQALGSQAQRRPLLAELGQHGIVQFSPWTPALPQQLALLGGRTADAMVVNMVPHQPESALPDFLTRQELVPMLVALEGLALALKPRRVLIAVDRHDHATARAWAAAARGKPWKVIRLINKYPLAHPRVLLHRLGINNSDISESPAARGRLLVDPVTCWAIGHLLAGEKHITHRPVQVFVQGREPQMLLLRIGEPVAALMEQFGEALSAVECIANGMLAGKRLNPATDCIEASTEMLSFRSAPLTENTTDCIRCSWCVHACPTGLNPAALLAAAQVKATMPVVNPTEAFGCIGCGLCSYVCPCRLPLSQTIVQMSQQIIMPTPVARLATTGGGGA